MKPNFPAALLTALLALAAFPPQGRASLPQWYLDAGLPELDTDGDGIPDAWERRTFGDPSVFDSGLDRDRDGLTDLEEFILGTDPRTFSTMGDLWSDGEKVRAGLDPLVRVTPAVAFAQWLSFTGWDAQTWRMQTATNGAGFAVSYAGFVYNTSPYSETNPRATVDFWLATRTDRPALLTVADALATNSFPVPSGNRRVRLRVAYGGEVALTLDPLPGTLAQLPGATNGVWLCKLTVEPAESNTVVFASGETPSPVEGDPLGVNGILVQSQPASPFPQLGAAAPRVSLLPLRVTNGTRVLGDGYWCVCFRVPTCDWPNYGMVAGCCPGGVTVNGSAVSSNGDPLMDKTAAYSLWLARQPCLNCTVTQTVASATYPFLYERVIFTFRPCMPRPAGVYGAEENGGTHEPEYVETTECGGIGGVCTDGPVRFVGFSHASVNTRNLSVITVGNQDEDSMNHCLGLVWREGGSTNLFSLLDETYLSYKEDLYFTTTDLSVSDDGELEFGDRPKDLIPHICLLKLHYSPSLNIDQVFDKLWVVVNSPDTQTAFNNWYAQNSDISWTTNLPPPYSRITLSTNASNEISWNDPEPGAPNLWGLPHSINSYLHHNAKFEMRSGPVSGGYGHQATYDADGVLIENPIAAGTADASAPYYADDSISTIGAINHNEKDVLPYHRALQLDGNPVLPTDFDRNLNRPCIYKGSKTEQYVEKRPVLPTGKQ